jgi:hypothetical protein
VDPCKDSDCLHEYRSCIQEFSEDFSPTVDETIDGYGRLRSYKDLGFYLVLFPDLPTGRKTIDPMLLLLWKQLQWDPDVV